MDTLILSGATGYIGSQFVKTYQHKYKIYPIFRNSDLDLKKIGAQKMIHFATESKNESEMHKSNVKLPSEWLEAFIASGGKHFVNAGTYWQYKDNKPNNPVNEYARTKQAFQDILESKNISSVTLTLFDTYGPHDPRKKILSLLRDSKQLEMTSGKQIVNFTHVDDVVRGFDHALNLENGKTKYFLKSNEEKTLKELAELYIKLNDLKVSINWGAVSHSERDFFQSLDVLKLLPGWSPQIRLAQGLKGI